MKHVHSEICNVTGVQFLLQVYGYLDHHSSLDSTDALVVYLHGYRLARKCEYLISI